MIGKLFVQTLIDCLTMPQMWGLAVLGVAIGIVLGALPGVSSTMALAILLPVSFGREPAQAMLFLIADFVPSVHGGSISAILINIPGTPGAILIQFDGCPMAQAGRAGQALSLALIASTIGGLIGMALLIMLASPGMVGSDRLTDIGRFGFITRALQGGIELAPVTVGIFGLAEGLRNMAAGPQGIPRIPPIGSLLMPPRVLARLPVPLAAAG